MMTPFENLEDVIRTGLQTTAPSISLTVYLRGEQIVNRAYGYVDPDTQAMPTQTDTLFDLASVTKLYTTTAFLMQVAEGKITLDTPVVEVLPEFGASGARPIGPQQNPHTLELIPPDDELAKANPVDPAQITFRHLLTHTSGLAPWRDLFLRTVPTPPPPGQIDPVSHQSRLAQALTLISETPFVDIPDKNVRYSDLGLILTGAAVARINSADSLANVISERILKPNNLIGTTFNPRLDADGITIAPTEYDARWRGRRCHGEVHDENACGLGGIAGHAGLFSTADEVARFGLLWLNALLPDGVDNHLIPKQLAHEAISEQAVTGLERRGIGWMLRTPGHSSSGDHFSDESFGHTGFTGTSLWLDPKRALVVAALTNRVYHGREADAIFGFRKSIHDAVALFADSL